MATDHDFKIKNGAQIENGFLLIGKEALSSSDGYMGMKTSNMTGTSDYMIISGTGDNNTYLSAKDGASVYIRGGGNSSAHQLEINSSQALFHGVVNLSSTSSLRVSGTTVLTSARTLTNIASLDVNGNAAVQGYLDFDGGSQNGLIRFNGNNAIGYSNNFLYINPSNHFTSGVYINSAVKVDTGKIGSYNEDLKLRTGNTTALTLSYTDQSALFSSEVQIDSGADQILTLNQATTGWNYIGFESAGTRKFYLGNNASDGFVLGSDVSGKSFTLSSFGSVDFGSATFSSGRLSPTGIQMSVDTGLYNLNASLSYYSASNAVYLNGAGPSGWLRLNAAGTENNTNAINIFGSNAGANITLITAGTQRMNIDSSGNLRWSSTNTAILDSSRNLSNIASISSGAISSTGTISTTGQIEAGTNIQLGSGYNLTWGGAYNSGKPTIAANSNTIYFYPTGNVSGQRLYLNATSLVNAGSLISTDYIRSTSGGIFGKMSDEWQADNALRGGNFSADIGNDTTVLKLFPASVNDESSNVRAAGDYSTGIAFMHLDPDNSSWGTSYTGAQAWVGLKVESTPGQEFSSFVIATNSSSTAGTMPVERFKIDKTGAATFTSTISSGAITASGSSVFNPTSDMVVVNEPSTNTDLQTAMRVGTAAGGLYFTSSNAIIGKGAYYDGAWVATATSGTSIDFTASDRVTFNTFSGATVGGSAAYTARAYVSATEIYGYGKLHVAGSNTAEDSIRTTNGRLQLGPQTSGAGLWLDRTNNAQEWFIGLDNADSQNLRFYNSGNKMKIYASGTLTTSTSIYVGLAEKSRFSTDDNGGFGINYGTTSGTATSSLTVYNNTSPTIELYRNGTVYIHKGQVWDSTTQGTGKGSIHIDPNSNTDHTGGAITFGASDHSNGTAADAGIYVQSDGNYGTKMYLSTTDSYASGSKTAIYIDHAGNVDITRGVLKLGGTTVINSSRSLTNIDNIGAVSGHVSGKFAVKSTSIHGSYDFYNNGTTYLNGATIVDDILDITNSSTDSILRIANGANNAHDAVIQLSGSAANIATEGAEIWYDNSVGDVHIATTYNSADAAIRFHTRTAASKSTSNERFTITGDGNLQVADGKTLTLFNSSQTSGGSVNLPRAGGITFYGNSNLSHAIVSRNVSGTAQDDIRINSYADVVINLDSNSNNSADADLIIGRHGGGTGTVSQLHRISGEQGTSSSFIGSNATYSKPVLEITASNTPSQIKITTNILYSGSGASTHAHSVTIRGFQYGSANMADLQIGWHVYNNQFYNRTVVSSGSWAPTVTLAVENNKVVIHLASPGYWPKLYVESMYNAYGGSGQAIGWSWADAAISADANTPNQTVPYKSDFGNGVKIDNSGNFKVGSSTVIDSSRNLTNVGTISSGAITSTGTSSFNNFRLTDSSRMGFGTVKSGATVGHGAGADEGIFWHTDSSYGIYRTQGTWTSPNYQQLKLDWPTGIIIDGGSAYGKSGVLIDSKLSVATAAYEGSIVFGTQDSWHSGIRQHDDGDAELRIWHKHGTRGRIHIATAYDGEPADISRPTNGITVYGASGLVGIGDYSQSTPNLPRQLNVKGDGDALLRLEGTNTWSGIEFVDSGGSDFIWYYGATDTWAFGGGGSSSNSNKRIHCHGGMSIGASYNNTAPPDDGVIVQGGILAKSPYSGGSGDYMNVTTAPLKIAPTSGYWRIPHDSNDSTVSGVYNYETGKDVYWGEPNDTGTYRFRGRDLKIEDGGLYMGTNQVLNSSRQTGTQIGMGIQHALVATNFGHGVYGTYSPTRYQHVWGMGTSYNLPANGLDTSGAAGNFYGLAWTYNPDYGGTGNNPQAKAGLNHQLLLMMGGTTRTALGSGIWTEGNVTAYSDRRVKTNIEHIPNALEKVNALNGYTFDRTDQVVDEATGEKPKVRQTGVIAQEVLEVLPEAVTGTEEQGYSVAYGNLAGLFIEAIKEQQEKIEKLEELVQKLISEK